MCITLPYWHAWLLKCLHLKSWMVCFFFFTPEVFAVSKNHFPWSNLFPLYLNPSSIQKTLWLYRVSCLFCSFFICVFFFFKYINKLCSRTLSFHESMISFSQLSCPCPQCSTSQGLEGLVCSALYHRWWNSPQFPCTFTLMSFNLYLFVHKSLSRSRIPLCCWWSDTIHQVLSLHNLPSLLLLWSQLFLNVLLVPNSKFAHIFEHSFSYIQHYIRLNTL